VGPNIRPENMDDHVPVVHQDPLRCRCTFDAERVDALLGQAAVDMVCDRANLPVGPARAEHQIIGNGGEFPDVEHHDVLGLFVERRGGDGEGFSL
jgi:hypothetical protein